MDVGTLKGLVKLKDLNKCLRYQAKHIDDNKVFIPIGKILVENEFLTIEQLKTSLIEQDLKLKICTSCKKRPHEYIDPKDILKAKKECEHCEDIENMLQNIDLTK